MWCCLKVTLCQPYLSALAVLHKSTLPLPFYLQAVHPAPAEFWPEPDFCRISKKRRILAGAGAEAGLRCNPSAHWCMVLPSDIHLLIYYMSPTVPGRTRLQCDNGCHRRSVPELSTPFLSFRLIPTHPCSILKKNVIFFIRPFIYLSFLLQSND